MDLRPPTSIDRDVRDDIEPDPQDVSAQLAELAAALVTDPPVDADGAARLVGLLPAEPVIGEVAIACWRSASDGELYELVRLEGGERVDDVAGLREAFTLVAMCEAIDDLASAESIDAAADALAMWVGAAGDRAGELPATLVDTLDAAQETLAVARAVAGEPGVVRVARAARLDQVGAALRDLEVAWARLEAAADEWSRGELGDDAEAASAVSRERVKVLWQALQVARRGPLARSSGEVVQEARAAARAMAAAVAGR